MRLVLSPIELLVKPPAGRGASCLLELRGELVVSRGCLSQLIGESPPIPLAIAHLPALVLLVIYLDLVGVGLALFLHLIRAFSACRTCAACCRSARSIAFFVIFLLKKIQTKKRKEKLARLWSACCVCLVSWGCKSLSCCLMREDSFTAMAM